MCQQDNIVFDNKLKPSQLKVSKSTTGGGSPNQEFTFEVSLSNPDGISPDNISMEFDEEGFKELLLGLDLDMEVVGILHTFNDSVADAVIDESHKILYGRDYYNEEILGLKFKVKAFAFFQTNIDAVERLYSDVLKVVPDVSGKTVYDLYCGTGTIGLSMAHRAKQIIGVEVIDAAIENAKDNAARNGIENARFFCDDASGAAKRLQQEGLRPDVVVLDPPRKGCAPDVIDAVAAMAPDRVVYVSCDPATLARDCKRFSEMGYRAEEAVAVDMFPRTVHVETVVQLSKGNISSRRSE